MSLAGMALAANPVEGDSWQPVDVSFKIQQCAGGQVNGDEFVLPDQPNGSTSGAGCSNGHLRAERRYTNNYSDGVHQFGGTLTVNSLGGDKVAVKQTFNGDSGPYFIMAVKSNGDLYSVEGSATIASGVAQAGQSVTINTVHDTGASRFTVYVNGEKAYEDTNAPGGSFYDKLGAYTTNSGSGPADITWSDLSFWTK